MQITSIELNNIKSHGDKEFSFFPGINVLSGPNGAGKSTIFEAIGYAMFGVDARDFVGNIERFVSIGAKKGKVTVTFQINGGDKYRVSRTVGAGSKWLLSKEMGDDFEVEEHANNQETEARLKELLELDNSRALAEQFKLVIGPFQNDFLGPFVIKQPTKRQEAFDEILGIDDWRKTFKGTAALLATIKGNIDVLDAEISSMKDRVSALPDKKKELKTLRATLKSKKAELKSRIAELDKFSKLVNELDQQKKQIEKFSKELGQTQASIDSGNEYISSQEQLVKQSLKAADIIKQSLPGKEAFEKVESKRKELTKQEQRFRLAEKHLTALENKERLATQDYENVTKETKNTDSTLANEKNGLQTNMEKAQPDKKTTALAAKLSIINEELEKLTTAKNLLEGKLSGLLDGRDKLDEGVCPFFQEPCLNISGKTPKDVFTSKEQEQTKEINGLETKISELKQEHFKSNEAHLRVTELKVRLDELVKSEQSLKLRLQANEAKKAELKELDKKQLEAKTKVEEAKLALSAFTDLDKLVAKAEEEQKKHRPARDLYFINIKYAEDLSGHKLKLEKYNERMDVHKKTLQALQKEMSQLMVSYNERQHEDSKSKRDSLLELVAAIKEKLDNVEDNQARLMGDVEELNKINAEIVVKSDVKATFVEKNKLVKFLRTQIFNNVSNQLSERYREEISLRADQIYRTISESDEELYWGDNYQIVLKDLHEGQIRERTDDQLSGGQTMSTVVSLRLALLQTIGARIAFFDEPTSNLDVVRRENLANAFRAIDIGKEGVTEHWYDQLFLVSHDVAFTEVTDQIIVLDLAK